MRVLLVNLFFLYVVLSVSALKEGNNHDVFKNLEHFANPQAAIYYTESMTQAMLEGKDNLKRERRSPKPDKPPKPPGKTKNKGNGPGLVYDPSNENYMMPFSDVPLRSMFTDLSGVRMEDGAHDGVNTRNRRSPQMPNMPAGGGFGNFGSMGKDFINKKGSKKGRKRRDDNEFSTAEVNNSEQSNLEEASDNPWKIDSSTEPTQ